VSLLLHVGNLVGAALPNRGGFAARRALFRAGGVQIGDRARIASGVRFYDRYATVGEATWIGMDTRVMSCCEGPIHIGARVDIAPMCLIGSGTHEVGSADRRAGRGIGKPVVVGDGTWIGMGARVLPGARIGAGSIVAAGAVVLEGEYPPNALLVGVPARVAKAMPER
jgi:maltose O-acetyltransferase